jgi:hypothetical protein
MTMKDKSTGTENQVKKWKNAGNSSFPPVRRRPSEKSRRESREVLKFSFETAVGVHSPEAPRLGIFDFSVSLSWAVSY